MREKPLRCSLKEKGRTWRWVAGRRGPALPERGEPVRVVQPSGDQQQERHRGRQSCTVHLLPPRRPRTFWHPTSDLRQVAANTLPLGGGGMRGRPTCGAPLASTSSPGAAASRHPLRHAAPRRRRRSYRPPDLIVVDSIFAPFGAGFANGL